MERQLVQLAGFVCVFFGCSVKSANRNSLHIPWSCSYFLLLHFDAALVIQSKLRLSSFGLKKKMSEPQR